MLTNSIHPSWQDFLTPARLEQLKIIESQIEDLPINPTKDMVLLFLSLDLHAIKVVILGQDPYPQAGVATGRAFQVGGLDSWLKPIRQTSLRNILRLLYKNYNAIMEYDNIPSFKQIQAEIKNGEFLINNPYDLFLSWEQQGVLLLNTSFSCLQGKPNSHRHLWTDFSEGLIAYIASVKPDIKWFLWGKSAQQYLPLIRIDNAYTSRHPMMCSAKYDDDFLKNNCFFETKNVIDWLGIK